MGEMKVSLCGIELDNPVIPASGTFGFGYEFAEIYDINVLGTETQSGSRRIHSNVSAAYNGNPFRL